jgi:AcrR family transcriptional regulator
MPRAALSPTALEDFRRRACEVALRLYAAHGYPAVTMRALAAELGVSAMTPYRYFESKEALFARVRARAFGRFRERLTAALPGRGGELTRLRRLKAAYVGFAVEHPDAYRIMFELRLPEAARDPALVAESRRAFAPLLGTVQSAVAKGELRGDPLTIAHLLWAGAHGLVTLHLAGHLGAERSLAQLAAVGHDLAPFLPKKSERKT